MIDSINRDDDRRQIGEITANEVEPREASLIRHRRQVIGGPSAVGREMDSQEARSATHTVVEAGPIGVVGVAHALDA